MRIYLKLLPILLIATLSAAWIPTTKKVVALSPRSDSRLAQELVREIKFIGGNVLGSELDELLAVGNVQEIIWNLHDRGAEERANELQALLQYRLEHSAVLSVRNIGIGISAARLLELDDGLRVVFKTTDNSKDNFKRELLLYRFDNLIGTHVVPLTTMRTLAGEEGSVQLYVENSLSAFDILMLKRRQLGLSDDPQYSHVLFSRAITPPASPTIKTLRLLSLEKDVDNPGNYLFPRRGRQIAIDGGRAFTANDRQVRESIRHLQKYSEEYHYEDTFIIKLEKNLAEIETMLGSSHTIQHLHETLAIYKKMVKNKHNMHRKGRKKPERAMLEALATENWQEADRLLKLHENLLYLESPDLLAVVRWQKNWQLLKWMRQHDPHLGDNKVLEYALSGGDYKFAARLSSIGLQTRPAFNIVHEDMLQALAEEQGVPKVDWQQIDWETIDWQAVHGYTDPTVFHRDSATTDTVLKYLNEALLVGDLETADSMLHHYCYETVPTEAQQLALVSLLSNEEVVKSPQMVAWLTTHEVMLAALAKPIVSTNGYYEELSVRLRNHIFIYATTPSINEREVQAREEIIDFLTRIYMPNLAPILIIDLVNVSFDYVLENKNDLLLQQATLEDKNQHRQRLQRVLAIFRANGMSDIFRAKGINEKLVVRPQSRGL